MSRRTPASGWRYAEAVKLTDEFPHRALGVAPGVSVVGDVRRDIPFEPRLVVPVAAGRLRWTPLLPGRIGPFRLDLDDAVPYQADSCVRVQPTEVVGNLYKSRFCLGQD